MSIPPTWGDLGDKRDFSRNGIQAITFRSEISRVSLGNRGGGDEGAGTKQNFSVQCTEVAPDLDTPGRKGRGRLKKLILKGAQSWRFCCYNWRSLYSYLSPPIPSLSLAPPPQVLVWGLVSCVPFYRRLWREEPRMWKMAQAGGDH